MGIAWVVFRENVDRRLLLGASAILAGAALLSWHGQTSFQWTALPIAGACMCWGIVNNLTRNLSSSDPMQSEPFCALPWHVLCFDGLSSSATSLNRRVGDSDGNKEKV
jgi:drug/metabolite transporter (DMT)-like permease